MTKDRDFLTRQVIAMIEEEASDLIGAELCPDPSWPGDMPMSLHEVETEEGHACLGCGAVV